VDEHADVADDTVRAPRGPEIDDQTVVRPPTSAKQASDSGVGASEWKPRVSQTGRGNFAPTHIPRTEFGRPSLRGSGLNPVVHSEPQRSAEFVRSRRRARGLLVGLGVFAGALILGALVLGFLLAPH
jgi:hypothetical protein